MIRHDGRFAFNYNGKRIDASYKQCKVIQKNDGYDYIKYTQANCIS